MAAETPNPQFILPVGTQIVALVETRGADGKPVHPRGAVGVVVQAPADYWHAYRVRFPDGFETALKRQELAILSHYQSEAAGLVAGPLDALSQYNLFDYVIYRCVIGSRAYGLEDDASDTDRRGVYLPPADMHWSLYGIPEQLEDPAAQETYWEVQKFLVLALKANPNVLECLFTPLVEHAAPLARRMLDMRDSFLSKMVYQTYNGYGMSQFKKLQADLRNKGKVKWKHVMHLIRLLLSGIGLLEQGVLSVHVGPHRQQLLAIKAGQVPWDEVEKWRLSLHRQFDDAASKTRLPDRPDYARANALLLTARRMMVGR